MINKIKVGTQPMVYMGLCLSLSSKAQQFGILSLKRYEKDKNPNIIEKVEKILVG